MSLESHKTNGKEHVTQSTNTDTVCCISDSFVVWMFIVSDVVVPGEVCILFIYVPTFFFF